MWRGGEDAYHLFLHCQTRQLLDLLAQPVDLFDRELGIGRVLAPAKQPLGQVLGVVRFRVHFRDQRTEARIGHRGRTSIGQFGQTLGCGRQLVVQLGALVLQRLQSAEQVYQTPGAKGSNIQNLADSMVAQAFRVVAKPLSKQA